MFQLGYLYLGNILFEWVLIFKKSVAIASMGTYICGVLVFDGYLWSFHSDSVPPPHTHTHPTPLKLHLTSILGPPHFAVPGLHFKIVPEGWGEGGQKSYDSVHMYIGCQGSLSKGSGFSFQGVRVLFPRG